MFNFTKILFSKREVWLNRIKREAIVKNSILTNSKPSVANVSAALDLPLLLKNYYQFVLM